MQGPNAAQRRTPANPPAYERPARAPLTPSPPLPDEDTDDDFTYEYVGVGRPSLLSNPYAIAGGAVVAAILLAIVFVIVASGGGEGGGGSNGGIAVTRTPSGGTQVPGGTIARSIALATVRDGPSTEYPEIGTLSSNQDMQVTGRNTNATWYQIVFPRNSTLKGWVPATALKLPEGSTTTVPVVETTPIARNTAFFPTSTPELALETPTPTPEVTATAIAAPDISIAIFQGNCTAGGSLVVVLTNVGTSPITNRSVTVTAATTSGVIGSASVTIDLAPGAATNVATNMVVQNLRTTVSVQLLGEPIETNNGNNSIDCVPAGGGGPTAVPPPIGGTSTAGAPTATAVPPTKTPTPPAP